MTVDTQSVCCGVIGNPSTGEFRLIEVGHGDVPKDEVAKLRARGLYFVGSLTSMDGMVAVECDDPNSTKDSALMMCACLEFVRRIKPLKDDGGASVAWLESLYRLEDKRD